MQLDNEFTVKGVDLKTFSYPSAEVKVWSRVFESGGSVEVEAKEPEGRRFTLYKIEIGEDRSVVEERRECQELADEWNENLKENWNNELLRCFKYLADYEQRQVDSVSEHTENLKKYKATVRKLNKLVEE